MTISNSPGIELTYKPRGLAEKGYHAEMVDFHLPPVIAAPMAGGASTPELVSNVGHAGGLGFLAAGYKAPEALAREVNEVQSTLDRPFGVNLFVPPMQESPSRLTNEQRREVVDRYSEAISSEVHEHGAHLGEPQESDDDAWGEKIHLIESSGCTLVSFTFGIPPQEVLRSLASVGVTCVVTVTSLPEARASIEAGADVLCVQGPGAGGHRGTHDPLAEPSVLSLPSMIKSLSPTGVPLIAAGGISTVEDVRSLLRAGATSVQLGTMFLPAPESGASIHHKAALGAAWAHKTRVTRAFSGRYARGIENSFMRRFDRVAPAAYPEVHHLTQPMRATAARQGNVDHLALWAGTGHRSATARPAAEIVERVLSWAAR